MPEIGFAEAPICPVMRLDTDTKRKAKATASNAPTSGMRICGKKTIAATHASTPIATIFMESSRSVRTVLSPPPPIVKPAFIAARIIGIARPSDIRPAAVTAPAPM